MEQKIIKSPTQVLADVDEAATKAISVSLSEQKEFTALLQDLTPDQKLKINLGILSAISGLLERVKNLEAQVLELTSDSNASV